MPGAYESSRCGSITTSPAGERTRRLEVRSQAIHTLTTEKVRDRTKEILPALVYSDMKLPIEKEASSAGNLFGVLPSLTVGPC
jgi:hypothetical protein